MINKRIFELASLTGITGNNYLLVDDSSLSSSKKITIDSLKDYVLSGGSYGTSGSSGTNGTSGSSGTNGTSGSSGVNGILPIIGNNTELLFRDSGTTSGYNTSTGLTYDGNNLRLYGFDSNTGPT